MKKMMNVVWLLVAVMGVMMIAGCSAIESVTEATKDKSVAMGSDTWGGGAEAIAASPESPTPTGSFWFGRRKVWYVSIKDKDTGTAAAEVVRASNSSIELSIAPDGATVGQKSTDDLTIQK